MKIVEFAWWSLWSFLRTPKVCSGWHGDNLITCNISLLIHLIVHSLLMQNYLIFLCIFCPKESVYICCPKQRILLWPNDPLTRCLHVVMAVCSNQVSSYRHLIKMSLHWLVMKEVSFLDAWLEEILYHSKQVWRVLMVLHLFNLLHGKLGPVEWNVYRRMKPTTS